MTVEDTGDNGFSPGKPKISPRGLGGKSGSRIGMLVIGGFLLVFSAMWFGVVGSGLLFAGGNLREELRRAYSYKPAAGTVTSYKAPSRDEYDEPISAQVEFSYQVGARQFTGKEWGSSDGVETYHEDRTPHVRDFQEGDTITVWYDPDSPSEHTLQPIAGAFPLVFLIFLMPFVLVGLGVLGLGLLLIGAALFGKEVVSADDIRRFKNGPPKRLRGLGTWFSCYSTLSAITAFAFAFCSFALHWETAIILGLGLWLGGVPLASVVIWRILCTVREHAKKPTPSKQAAETERFASDLIDGAEAAPEAPSAPEEEEHTLRAPPLPKVLGGAIGLGFFTLFWCGITGVFVFIAVSSIVQHLDAEARFLQTQGIVLASEIKSHSDSDGTTYSPFIEYTYTVNGHTYTSTRYEFSSWSASDHGAVKRIVDAYPKDKRITVHYDPDDPSKAILHLGIPSWVYFILLFLQPFILIGLGMAAGTVGAVAGHFRMRRFLRSRFEPPCHIPTWGFCQQEMGGLTIRKKAPLWAILVAMAAGYGGTCFVSVFAIALFLGGFGDTDPPVIVAALLLGAGIGVLAGVLCARKFARKARLHIDLGLGRLELKSSRRDVELKLSNVQSWSVRRITSPHNVSSDSSLPYAPLLYLTTREGEQVPIHVFKADAPAGFIARKVAEGFAELTARPFREPGDGHDEQHEEKEQELGLRGIIRAVRESRRNRSRQKREAALYADLT